MSGAELARKLEWRIWRNNVAANLAAAGLLVIIAVEARTFLTVRIPFATMFVRQLLCGLVFVVVCMFVEYAVVRRRFAPVRSYLVEERPPTLEERRATLAQPTRQGVVCLAYWAALFVWSYFLNRNSIVWSAWTDEKIAVAVFGWGIYASAITYLLVETTMRPVLPLAIEGDTRVRTRIESLLTRSLLIGGLGSGWVLVLFFALLLGSTPEQRATAYGGALIALVMAMAASLFLTIVSSRSVIRALRGVQRAMRHVAEGDLDVTVPIDDATEVGQLQAGFNQMLAGLRERERLRDLFGRHVGTKVAEQALGGEGMTAETREASVMFIDVIASTSLAQQRSAREVFGLLNALFDSVVRVVEGEGGFVNQFQGDGALCLFGAPHDLEDHAACALRAARTLRREIDELARANAGFNAAISVTTGEVVAGDLGSESRYEYTAVGDPVNEAARLCDAAKIYSCRLLAARSAVDAAPDEAPNWTYAGEFELRGRAQLTLGYVPLGS
jgi:adenylate cyclase